MANSVRSAKQARLRALAFVGHFDRFAARSGNTRLCTCDVAGKRTMPVRNVRPDSNAGDVAQRLAEQHPSLLGPNIVSSDQLERL
eukprot:6547140-Prymnesium_polylepis.1